MSLIASKSFKTEGEFTNWPRLSMPMFIIMGFMPSMPGNMPGMAMGLLIPICMAMCAGTMPIGVGTRLPWPPRGGPWSPLPRPIPRPPPKLVTAGPALIPGLRTAEASNSCEDVLKGKV